MTVTSAEYLEKYRTPFADRAFTQDAWIRANIMRMGGVGRRITGKRGAPKPSPSRKLFPWQYQQSEMESRGATPQAIRKQHEVRSLTAIK